MSLQVLRQRLVDIYVSGTPSIASMVLAANEYSDLVEMGPYLEAIQSRDESLVQRVRELKNEARKIVEARRDSKETIQTSRDSIAAETARLASARSETESQVASLASAKAASEEALNEVQDGIAQEEEVAADLREKLTKELGTATSVPFSVGPASTPSSNSMIWPIDGSTSPFGPRWGRTHEGLDIAAPAGTPIAAAASGRSVSAVRSRERRLRALHLRGSWRWVVHLLRPSVRIRNIGRGICQAGGSDRVRRKHRQQLW